MKWGLEPGIHRIYLIGSDALQSLETFNYAIIRRRLVDEHFILNSRSVLEMLGKEMIVNLPDWILVLGISGHGPLAQEAFNYRLADTEEIAKNSGVKLETQVGSLRSEDIQHLLNVPSSEPYWKVRRLGGCREIYFASTLDMIPEFHSLFLSEAEKSGIDSKRIGTYVQPIVQGVNTYCCFDIYYDPTQEREVTNMEKLYNEGSKKLMDAGAFFSRPPDRLSDVVYARVSPEVISAMNRVKRIFDPNSVLSPGNLCFEEVAK